MLAAKCVSKITVPGRCDMIAVGPHLDERSRLSVDPSFPETWTPQLREGFGMVGTPEREGLAENPQGGTELPGQVAAPLTVASRRSTPEAVSRSPALRRVRQGILRGRSTAQSATDRPPCRTGYAELKWL